MKKIKLMENREVSEEMRYKIKEISRDLFDCYGRLSKFGITDPRGHLAYSRAMEVINLMPYNEGRLDLIEMFNSARDSRIDTLDKMTVRVIAELPEFKKKRRGPYAKSYRRSYEYQNEYRRESQKIS